MSDKPKYEDRFNTIFDIEYLKAFTDPVRTELIRYLSLNGAKNISEISEHFPQDRSVISRHLDHLHKKGIVKKRKESRFMIYEMNGTAILERFEAITRNLKVFIDAC